MVTPKEVWGDFPAVHRIYSPSQVGSGGDETMIDTEAGDDGLEQIPVSLLAHVIHKQSIPVDSSEESFNGGGHFVYHLDFRPLAGRKAPDGAFVDTSFEATERQVCIRQSRHFNFGKVTAVEVPPLVPAVGEGILNIGVSCAGEALPFTAANVQSLSEKGRVFEFVAKDLLAPHQLAENVGWCATRHGRLVVGFLDILCPGPAVKG